MRRLALAFSFLVAATLAQHPLKTYAITTNYINGTVFHIDLSSTSLIAGTACAANTECSSSSIISLSGAAAFSSTNYSCYATQTGSAVYAGSFNFYPVTGSSVRVAFFNESGGTIPAATTINLAFICEGD